jgi:hypothetical protein
MRGRTPGLVGRADECRQILLEGARGGHRALLVVEGEAGTGKAHSSTTPLRPHRGSTPLGPEVSRPRWSCRSPASTSCPPGCWTCSRFCRRPGRRRRSEYFIAVPQTKKVDKRRRRTGDPLFRPRRSGARRRRGRTCAAGEVRNKFERTSGVVKLLASYESAGNTAAAASAKVTVRALALRKADVAELQVNAGRIRQRPRPVAGRLPSSCLTDGDRLTSSTVGCS